MRILDIDTFEDSANPSTINGVAVVQDCNRVLQAQYSSGLTSYICPTLYWMQLPFLSYFWLAWFLSFSILTRCFEGHGVGILTMVRSNGPGCGAILSCCISAGWGDYQKECAATKGAGVHNNKAESARRAPYHCPGSDPIMARRAETRIIDLFAHQQVGKAVVLGAHVALVVSAQAVGTVDQQEPNWAPSEKKSCGVKRNDACMLVHATSLRNSAHVAVAAEAGAGVAEAAGYCLLLICATFSFQIDLSEAPSHPAIAVGITISHFILLHLIGWHMF